MVFESERQNLYRVLFRLQDKPAILASAAPFDRGFQNLNAHPARRAVLADFVSPEKLLWSCHEAANNFCFTSPQTFAYITLTIDLLRPCAANHLLLSEKVHRQDRPKSTLTTAVCFDYCFRQTIYNGICSYW